MANKQLMVFVGTRKGGLIFKSDASRKKWEKSDLQFKSWNVYHMRLDPRDRRLHAAVVHDVYGASTQYSDDFGGTWKQAGQIPAFPRASASGRPIGSPAEAAQAVEGGPKPESTPEKLRRVWHFEPGRPEEKGVLYAGVEPAALFRSADRGESWEVIPGLFDHPHRSQWYPGAGGLCLHTILLDPTNPLRIFVAISSGGCYRSDDGGKTWNPYNRNTRADFMPNKFPEFGQCVHRIAMHPSRPQVLYQQNHCGVYRSDNAGEDWIDIGEGKLSSRFGFPIAVHPHQPNTIYIVPEESDEYRVSIAGKFAVWRSRDRGENWQRLEQGLPQQAHLVVLREAMATDELDDAGIYIGTSTGQLFFSRDAGDHWELLADYLPPVLSVEASVV